MPPKWVGLLISISVVKINSHRYAQRLTSLAILTYVRLTVDVSLSHHSSCFAEV